MHVILRIQTAQGEVQKHQASRLSTSSASLQGDKGTAFVGQTKHTVHGGKPLAH